MTNLIQWVDEDGDEFVLIEDFAPQGLILSVWNDIPAESHVEPNEVYLSRKNAKRLRKALKQWLKETK